MECKRIRWNPREFDDICVNPKEFKLNSIQKGTMKFMIICWNSKQYKEILKN